MIVSLPHNLRPRKRDDGGSVRIKKVGRCGSPETQKCLRIRHAFVFLAEVPYSVALKDQVKEMSDSGGNQASSSKAPSASTEPPKKFPKGVVLGKDGKP